MFFLPPDPPPIIGRATVIDGDTIEIHGQRIRLWGIDAPESRQTCTRAGETYRCGQEAANYLSDLLNDRVVRCQPRGRPDRYRRIIATCSYSLNGSVSPWELRGVQTDLVVAGHALDYPRYSGGAFSSAQATAGRSRAGMWAGEFQRPWEWRAR